MFTTLVLSSQPPEVTPRMPPSALRRDLDSMQLQKPDFSNLPKFEKNFYMEHPAVRSRTDAEVQAYRQQRQIHVYGEGVPKPVTSFEEASFPGVVADVPFAQLVQLRWRQPRSQPLLPSPTSPPHLVSQCASQLPLPCIA